MTIQCRECGANETVGDNVISVLCWRCTMLLCIRQEKLMVNSLLMFEDYDTIIDALADNAIKKLRVKYGLTVRDMAKKLGLSKSTYCRCEESAIISVNIINRTKRFLNKEREELHKNGTRHTNIPEA